MYYTLLTKYGDKWSPQFGDHDRQVVLDEKGEYRAWPTKIIKTQSARQSLIDAELAKLNRVKP